MEHHFNTEIAKEHGIEEAIMLHNLFFWISKNAANGKNQYDGSYWTYNSVQGYVKLFPYLNIDKIKRVLAYLVKKEILKKGNYNENRMNHTNWYAFTEKGLEYMALHEYKLPQSNDAKHSERLVQNAPIEQGKSHQCNNTDIKQEYNKHKYNTTTKVVLSSADDSKVDFDKFLQCFNNELDKHGSMIPKIVSLSEKRKAAIKARAKEHGKAALFTMVQKAAASQFLNGRNNRTFIASFDWLMKPANFVKVLEGNYDDNLNSNYNGNNKADYDKEQRAREVAEAISRRFAADDADAEQQAGVFGAVQSR